MLTLPQCSQHTIIQAVEGSRRFSFLQNLVYIKHSRSIPIHENFLIIDNFNTSVMTKCPISLDDPSNWISSTETQFASYAQISQTSRHTSGTCLACLAGRSMLVKRCPALYAEEQVGDQAQIVAMLWTSFKVYLCYSCQKTVIFMRYDTGQMLITIYYFWLPSETVIMCRHFRRLWLTSHSPKSHASPKRVAVRDAKSRSAGGTMIDQEPSFSLRCRSYLHLPALCAPYELRMQSNMIGNLTAGHESPRKLSNLTNTCVSRKVCISRKPYPTVVQDVYFLANSVSVGSIAVA
jgi:hypothetical protein